MSDESPSHPAASSTSQSPWSDLFPFDPYPNQVQGINAVRETLLDGGIHVLEGACGTGKTLIALVAGLSAIRNPATPFERLLVITSKKQQLAAFESDLQAINDLADVNVPSLTLVGKSDLCPYVRTGHISSQDIYHRCISLRDNTREVMKRAVDAGRTDREVTAAFGLELKAESDSPESTRALGDSPLPYVDEIPTAMGEDYCPYYASHIVNTVEEDYPLDIDGVQSAADTLEQAAGCGTCPHLEMRRLHEEATVLLGNYQHAFDATTVAALTKGLVDETTLLICDEAHNLVSEVRDQLSYSLSFSQFDRGIANLKQVSNWVAGRGNARKCRLAMEVFSNTELSEVDFTRAIDFFETARSVLTAAVTRQAEHEFGDGFDWASLSIPDGQDRLSLPLQDPEDPKPDTLSKWAAHNDYGPLWEESLKVAKLSAVIKGLVSRTVEGKSPDGSFPVGTLYETLERWKHGDNTEYLRRVTLTPTGGPATSDRTDRPWTGYCTATLRVNNSIPQNEIAATLDAYGGAVLMSATLSPLDVYEQVTGVSKLETGSQPADSLVTRAAAEADDSTAADDEDDDGSGDGDDPTNREGDSASPAAQAAPDLNSITSPELDLSAADKERRKRPIGRSVFGNTFPKEHRGSFAVDLPKFTYSNRWPPDQNLDTRKAYAQCITTVVRTTPGNVLIYLPSYQEASWASHVLENHHRVDRPVLTDRPSSAAETHLLKERFIEGEPKVLTTSLRGTLTEGVDFDGDSLLGVVICGVPITQTPLAKAIQTAYDHRFDGHGFEYAFAVPAVQKVRQAVGRVIRGSEDVGVRVLVDERYVKQDLYSSVREYIPEYERNEFVSVGLDDLAPELSSFWEQLDSPPRE